MADTPGTDPISADELLYRRIPDSQNWHDPVAGTTDPFAFRPTQNDDTGLSLTRAKYRAAEDEAASGRVGKLYWIAVLRVADLASGGISVVSRPTDENPGHAEIPSLTYQNRKTDESITAGKQLRDAIVEVHGPFPGKRPPR